MEPVFIVIDLFGGGGGDATGMFNAKIEQIEMKIKLKHLFDKIAQVIACVNHDDAALKTHHYNYPFVKHFKEDIRTLDLTELIALVNHYRSLYPNSKLILWGSFPCHHFSKALGNKPKDEGIRTMAKSLYMNFDIATQKHVAGDSYIQLLNPDYIVIENVEEFKSWGDLDERGKPISKKNGIEWLKWKQEVCSYGYNDEWKELNSADFGAYTSRNRLFGIFAKKGLPISFPLPTHAKNPRIAGMFGALEKWLPISDVLDFNDIGESIISRKKPLAEKTIQGIIKGIKKFSLNNEEYFLFHYYGNSFSTSLKSPCPSFRTKQSAYLIHAFIHNPSHGGNCSSITQPCPVIVARQDKAPLRLVTVVKNKCQFDINENDSPAYKELKTIMIENNIQDIFYRPLRIHEKQVIQGFPKSYKFFGTQAQQDKQIGNSVVPKVAEVIVECLAEKLINDLSVKAA